MADEEEPKVADKYVSLTRIDHGFKDGDKLLVRPGQEVDRSDFKDDGAAFDLMVDRGAIARVDPDGLVYYDESTGVYGQIAQSQQRQTGIYQNMRKPGLPAEFQDIPLEEQGLPSAVVMPPGDPDAQSGAQPRHPAQSSATIGADMTRRAKLQEQGASLTPEDVNVDQGTKDDTSKASKSTPTKSTSPGPGAGK